MAKGVVVTSTDNATTRHLRKVNILTSPVAGTSLPVWTQVTDDGHNTFETVVATASPVAGLKTVVAANYVPPDTTAPTITSASTANNAEGSVLAHALTANETVTWSLTGGADVARFELSGSTLRWLSNGVKDFEAPDDADTNNTYVVQVTATDASSNAANQTITVTVTDVSEFTEQILDAYTTGLATAFSFSRNLLTSFGGSRYTNTGGLVDQLTDQSGNNRQLLGNTTRRPTTTTAGPNSRLAVDFTGDGDTLRTTGGGGQQLSNFITNSNGWMAISFIPDTIDSNAGVVYSNEALVGDSGGFVGLFTKTGDALHVYNYDGTTDTTSTAITEGTPYVAEWRHEGGTLYCRINGGTEVSVASGNTSGLTGAVCLGSTNGSADAASAFDGKIFEFITYTTTPSLADRNIIVANMRTWIGAA